MAAYVLIHDAESGAIVCRIVGPLSDVEARKLGTELRALSRQYRRQCPVLRMLFDNREGALFSTATLEALSDLLKLERKSGDRTAILVSSSLMKVQAKRNMYEGDQVFISESAAMTWLNAWGSEGTPFSVDGASQDKG